MTDPKSPAQLASAAAESIRGLNHATLAIGHLDWGYPSHAYSVIGGLERTTGYLPQALDQVRSLLSGLAVDGHVGSTTGHPHPHADVAKAMAALEVARAAAVQLNTALQSAHNAISPLTYEG